MEIEWPTNLKLCYQAPSKKVCKVLPFLNTSILLLLHIVFLVSLKTVFITLIFKTSHLTIFLHKHQMLYIEKRFNNKINNTLMKTIYSHLPHHL